MPKCIIDGKEVEFAPGENLVEVAKRAGVEIPIFCYHPGLSVVAQCRMCAVEIEKSPKLQTACSTTAAPGMVVQTRSDRAKQNQKSVMEFLLLNHPLDCPICDKAGECDLQDNSYKFGDTYRRSGEERRTYVDLDMGPVIKKNMNRCIHCTRCVRFGDEIAGIREMVAVNRGNSTEISTIDGKHLETKYAGNYSDICPTGSLTLKDFRFKKRVWFLKKTSTVCEGCSRGCSIELHHEDNTIYRTIARENSKTNKYWICDEGRFLFQYIHHPDRIIEPKLKTKSDWQTTVKASTNLIKDKKIAILAGSDLTLEDLKALSNFASDNLQGAQILHFGTPNVKATKDDTAEDKILRRRSKTSNLHGFEKAGIKPFSVFPAGTEAVLVVRGGRAVIPDAIKLPTIGIGVFTNSEAGSFDVVLPSASFAEKSGTIVNCDGIEQKLNKAVELPPNSLPLVTILELLAKQLKGVQ